MPRQRRHILPPLPQGRDLQGHHGQPVVQVFAEPADRDLGLQVAVGGGDDPDIHLHPGRPADPLETLLLQGADDLALGLKRHVGHLVEQQGAAMGAFQHPGPARRGQRIGAGFQAEQLLLEAGRVQGGAVQCDEGAIGPARARMDHPRRHFLARPGRAGDQHAAAGRRHAIDRRPQLGHPLGGADQLGIRAGPQPQLGFSRRSRAASRARATTSSSRSELNGFSMKS